MAVLIEAISVVVRADAIHARYRGGWDVFRDSVCNRTLCGDYELARIGFMTPADVEGYVGDLERSGLTYIEFGRAKDLVVVDQMRGPTAACEWIEFGHIDLDDDPKKRIAACRLKGSLNQQIVMPEGWSFESSLSSTYGFIPNDSGGGLTFLRHEDGLDVYFNELTGKEVFVGRRAPITRER